ncbi:MAG: hypothetical protein K6T31_09935, partial [Alicyclobacillus sp.]|nr:hypothetical protein [Alicyclobacillus sp.]
MRSKRVTSGSAQQVRRMRAHITTMGITHIHLRKPWVPAFWSFSFPGLGYISMSRYIKGFVLVVWEIVVNNLAHINQAILETLLGRWGEAKAVLDVHYLLL